MSSVSVHEGEVLEQDGLLETEAKKTRPPPVKLVIGTAVVLIGAMCVVALKPRNASHLRGNGEDELGLHQVLTHDAETWAKDYQCTHPMSQTWQCMGLSFEESAKTPEMCEAVCCASSDCNVWQFNGPGYEGQCWMGASCGSGGGDSWSYGGMKITECAADWGSSQGDPVCCGQAGEVNSEQYICPASAPTCTGYVLDESWGTCQLREHRSLPKCVSGKQEIKLKIIATKKKDEIMKVQSSLNFSPHPLTDTRLFQAGIYAGFTEYFMYYLNNKVFPDMVAVLEASVNTALVKIDEKLINGDLSKKKPVLADVDFWNLHFWGFSMQGMSAQFLPGVGIQLTISGISLTGYCATKVRGLLFSTAGNVNFGVSNAEAQLLLIPTITSAGKLEFKYDMEDFNSGLYMHFKVHGWFHYVNPFSWMPDILAKTAVAVIGPVIIRDVVDNGVMDALQGVFSPGASVDVPTSSKTSIDMSAVAANTYWLGMLIAMSGAPVSDDSLLEYPKPPCPSAMPTQKSVVAAVAENNPFMFGFSVREYVINGQLYAMQAAGELELEVPSSDSGLTTNFDGHCDELNPSIPPCSIGKTFGKDTPVSLSISTSSAPKVNFSDSSIAVSVPLSIDFIADGDAESSSGLIFTLTVPLNIGVSPTATSTQETSSTGHSYSRTSFSAQLTTLSLTPMDVTKMGDGVKNPIMVGTKSSNLMVSEIVNSKVLPKIQSKLSKVSVEVPKPLTDTRLLLEAGAVTLASNIQLPPVTTTTTTIGPPVSCSEPLNLAGSCYGGDGLQACYTCQYWQCNQIGRRRRNQYWACNR